MGVSESTSWMPASHSEVQAVLPPTSPPALQFPERYNGWPVHAHPSSCLHFSCIFISACLENLIALISILNRLIRIRKGKAFFPLLPKFAHKNKINNYNNKNNKIKAHTDKGTLTKSLAFMKTGRTALLLGFFGALHSPA